MTAKRLRPTTRREFLKRGAAGIAGAALIPHLPGCSTDSDHREAPAGSSPEGASSVVRTLGRTGLRLPMVSMGTGYDVNLVHAALEAGVVYLHTSSSYAEGKHERLLGRALQSHARDSYVIATSPDLQYAYSRSLGRTLGVGTAASPTRIVESLDRSLSRLAIDHVDIYYLASVGSRDAVLHEPYLRAFEQLKQSGKTRFVGIATHSNEPEVMRTAAAGKFWDVALTAYNFRQQHRLAVRAAIRDAAAAGMGIVAMKTQAGVYWDAARSRMINMKAALKWALADENVHTAIPAFANFSEMREDLSVMEDLALTPREREDLELAAVHGDSGLYCQQCGGCLTQCPEDVNIPALMRARMYDRGYRDPQRALRLLKDQRCNTEIACTRCETCVVGCPLGHDVRSAALQSARLLATDA